VAVGAIKLFVVAVVFFDESLGFGAGFFVGGKGFCSPFAMFLVAGVMDAFSLIAERTVFFVYPCVWVCPVFVYKICHGNYSFFSTAMGYKIIKLSPFICMLITS